MHALCTHRVLRAVRQVWLRLDLRRDWSHRFRWSSQEVSGIIGEMSDRHKIGWWNIIRKPFVMRGEPGSQRGVVSLKWSHPSTQLHIWLGHELLLKRKRVFTIMLLSHRGLRQRNVRFKVNKVKNAFWDCFRKIWQHTNPLPGSRAELLIFFSYHFVTFRKWDQIRSRIKCHVSSGDDFLCFIQKVKFVVFWSVGQGKKAMWLHQCEHFFLYSFPSQFADYTQTKKSVSL